MQATEDFERTEVIKIGKANYKNAKHFIRTAVRRPSESVQRTTDVENSSARKEAEAVERWVFAPPNLLLSKFPN